MVANELLLGTLISNMLSEWLQLHNIKNNNLSGTSKLSHHEHNNTQNNHTYSDKFHPRLQYFMEHKPQPFIHLSFVGDNATRNYICGITRMLSGSEWFGLCINAICGGDNNINEGNPISLSYQENQHFDAYFLNNTLLLSFMYVTIFLGNTRLTLNALQTIFMRKSFAVMFNTGLVWQLGKNTQLLLYHLLIVSFFM